MSARLAYVNILAHDIDALADFYASVLGFAEIEGHRSPIYRCLDANGAELGFNAPLARDLLNIDALQPGRADTSQQKRKGVATYITFEMGTLEELDSALKLLRLKVPLDRTILNDSALSSASSGTNPVGVRFLTWQAIAVSCGSFRRQLNEKRMSQAKPQLEQANLRLLHELLLIQSGDRAPLTRNF